ncbi:MAG: beta-ketoacyl synthase N-terminal-like domain-containing protein, partial [Verrucomicrobiia bacterium]
MQLMQKRRVVITGIGVVSPVGSGIETFWKNIVAGVSGVDRSPILVDSGCHWKIAGEVKGFKPKEWLGRKDANRMDRFAQLALVASYLGLQDSGLDLDKEDRH